MYRINTEDVSKALQNTSVVRFICISRK